MNWRYGVFVPPLVVSGTVAAVLSILVGRRLRTPGSTAFSVLTALMAVWSYANVLELGAQVLETKIFWANVQYLGITFIPVCWYVFTRQYVSMGRWASRRWMYALAVIPIVTNVLLWSDPMDGLMRRDVSLDASGPWSVVAKTYGPWLLVHLPYSYGLLFAGALTLLRGLPRKVSAYRAQWRVLLVGVALPWLANIAYLVLPRTVLRIDVTPLAMTFSGLATAYALLRYGLLDIVPAAREQIVEEMLDGVLVVDVRERVVDMNAVAEALTGHRRTDALGRSVDDVVYKSLCPVREAASEDAPGEELLRGVLGRARYVDLRRSALLDRSSERIGSVITLRDVTRRREVEEERERLIGQLQQALAEVRTLSGLLPICSCCKRIRDDDGYWRQLEEYLGQHSDAQFTHGICPECMARLYADLPEGTPVDDRGK